MITRDHVRTTRTRAIAVGGRTLDPDEERAALPVELLSDAIGGLPDLTASALIGIDRVAPDMAEIDVRAARRHARRGACRALRLSQRALEADARNAGYDWHPWVEATIQDASIHLDRIAPQAHLPPCSLPYAAALATFLGVATRALTNDRMAVPEALSSAQTQALLLVVAAEP